MLRENRRELGWIFLLAVVLVFVTAIQLYVFPARTGRYFAWTIKPPLTAAFLGAGYWTACFLLLVSARERFWVNVRGAVVAVAVFVPLMFAATLVHLDRFHLGSGTASARAAGWGWLVFYAVVVVIVPLGLALQLLTVHGDDPPRTGPLRAWTRWLLALHALVFVGVGAALWITPGRADVLWPWALTPLTARAVGSWAIGIGAAAAFASVENDDRRTRFALVAYGLFGLLQLVAVLRFTGTLDWSDGRTWAYLAVLVSMAAVGASAVAAIYSGSSRKLVPATGL